MLEVPSDLFRCLIRETLATAIGKRHHASEEWTIPISLPGPRFPALGVEATTACHLVAGHGRLRNALYDAGFKSRSFAHICFVSEDNTFRGIQDCRPYSTPAPLVGGTARC